MKFSMNLKISYNGGEFMCDAETMDQSDRGIFKTEEGLQDLKNNANILTTE